MINATLCVQALHFACAYLVLKYLVVRPALSCITVQQQQEQKLHDGIQEAQEQVDQAYAWYNKHWRECVCEMHKDIPDTGRIWFRCLASRHAPREDGAVSCDEKQIIREIKRRAKQFAARMPDESY